MPLFNRAPVNSKFGSVTTFVDAVVQIAREDEEDGFGQCLPVEGEIIHSFEIADTPGGWHLVWLDQAIEYDGQLHAHLMIAPRWVARPLMKGQIVPINIRFVPNVALVQRGAPDIEKLPFASKGTAIIQYV